MFSYGVSLDRKKSKLWDFFEPISNFYASCYICKAKISYKSSITNLKKHIQNRHIRKPLNKRSFNGGTIEDEEDNLVKPKTFDELYNRFKIASVSGSLTTRRSPSKSTSDSSKNQIDETDETIEETNEVVSNASEQPDDGTHEGEQQTEESVISWSIVEGSTLKGERIIAVTSDDNLSNDNMENRGEEGKGVEEALSADNADNSKGRGCLLKKSPKEKKMKRPCNDGVDDFLHSIAERRKRSWLVDPLADEDMEFFRSVIPHMQKFTDLQKTRVRNKLLQAILDEKL